MENVQWHYYSGKKFDWMTDFWGSIPVWIFVFLLLLQCAFPLKIFYWISKVKAIFPFYFQLFWNVWPLTRCPTQHRAMSHNVPEEIWPPPPLNISKKNEEKWKNIEKISSAEKKFTHIPFVKEKEKFLLLLFPPIFLSF